MKLTAEVAFARHMNGVTISATGKVIKILPDDTDNTPHQKFVIEIHSGHTVLVSHNLLRAYRIPVKIGDKIEVHGSYVWNRYGGLLHNTHHYNDECQGPHCQPHDDGYVNFVGIHKNPHIEYGLPKETTPS